jgi:hypothetical protein
MKKEIKLFSNSLNAGEADCICSSCGKKIEGNEVPIIIFAQKENKEARFHTNCYAEVFGIPITTPDKQNYAQI